MNSRRSAIAHQEVRKRKTRETVVSSPMFTHCVVCDYESETDFDVCPRCKTKGMAVIVVRKG
jgi:hypothetical protein